MARKPNYGQNRAEVNRAKQARKEAKLEALKEAVARRKSGEDAPEGEGDAEGEEITEAEEAEVSEEEAEETEEVNAEESNPTVSEMLKEVYEMVKNEAKVWEEDAHDEHTVESYMKENAALVAALSANTLKEMKEEFSVEAYEAACNEMIEAYTKKINEMKEADSVSDAEDAAE